MLERVITLSYHFACIYRCLRRDTRQGGRFRRTMRCFSQVKREKLSCLTRQEGVSSRVRMEHLGTYCFLRSETQKPIKKAPRLLSGPLAYRKWYLQQKLYRGESPTSLRLYRFRLVGSTINPVPELLDLFLSHVGKIVDQLPDITDITCLCREIDSLLGYHQTAHVPIRLLLGALRWFVAADRDCPCIGFPLLTFSRNHQKRGYFFNLSLLAAVS